MFTKPRISATKTIALAVVCGCSGLAAPAAAQDEPTVAVFDFKIGTTETARVEVSGDTQTKSATVKKSRQTSLLTNKLITELTKTDAISVVERKKMQRIMEEAQLSQQNLTDPQNSTKMGQLLGADYMIFGSITMLDPSVQIKELAYNAGTQKIISMTVGATMRLVNSESGEIEAAADMQARNTAKTTNPASESTGHIPQPFMDQVYTDLVDKLARKIVTTLNPIKVAKQIGNTVYLARAGLTKGDRFRVVKLGEPIKDPDTGEVIGQTSRQVATIKVTDSMQSLSKAQVVNWKAASQKIPPGSICRPL